MSISTKAPMVLLLILLSASDACGAVKPLKSKSTTQTSAIIPKVYYKKRSTNPKSQCSKNSTSKNVLSNQANPETSAALQSVGGASLQSAASPSAGVVPHQPATPTGISPKTNQLPIDQQPNMANNQGDGTEGNNIEDGYKTNNQHQQPTETSPKKGGGFLSRLTWLKKRLWGEEKPKDGRGGSFHDFTMFPDAHKD